MTKQGYFEFAQKFFGRCVDISRKKNADYTGGDDDPFKNFKAIEALPAGVSAEQGIITRMTDKLARIASYVSQGSLQVEDESVIDTLIDNANYSALLAGLIKSRQIKPSTDEAPQPPPTNPDPIADFINH